MVLTLTNYRVPADRTARPISSAGVFDSTGRLVRVLWSAQRNDSRVNNPAAAWDGTLDTYPPGSLSIAPTGTYTIKVLEHDMYYQWNGTVGHTSPDHSNMFYHNGGCAICDMAITDAGKMYFTTGYHERLPVTGWTTTANPQVMDYPLAMGFRASYGSQFKCCTDGTLVYWGYVPVGFGSSGIYAIKCSDHTIWPFSSGSVFGSFNFVVDIRATEDISSLAVQKSGNFLFLCASSDDRVDVLNKTTGAVVQSYTSTYNAPTAFAVDPITGALWLAYSPGGVTIDTIIKLNVDPSTGALTASGTSIAVGGGNIVAMAISPDGSTLLAVDAGVAQQVRAFNTSDGSVKTAFGASGLFGTFGGYASSPTVTNTKFMFKIGSHFGGTAGYIAFAPDGSFWLGDSGNERSLHFSSGNSPTYIEQIAYNGGFYSCQVDRSDNTRVTVNFLEYQIDYQHLMLTPTNGSWVLLNNWSHLFDLNQSQAFTRLEFLGTYSNGRRYASVYDPALGQNRIWELTATGMRDTGVTFTRGKYIDANFNLNRLYFTGSGPATWRIKLDREPFAGFDGGHNPTWGAVVNLLTTGLLDFGTFPPPQGDPNFKVQTEGTLNGVLPIVQTVGTTPGTGNDYGRVGGIDLNTGAIRYDTHQQSPVNQTNQLTLLWPEAPFFSCSAALAGGPHFYIPGHNNFFTSYRGEEWGNNQTAMWYHWHESGLLLDMFGVACPYFGADSLAFPTGHTELPAIGAPTVGVPNRDMSFKGMAGLSGNFGWGGLAFVDGVYYIYPSDEWYHGLSRWSCRGMNTIRERNFMVSWNSATYTPFTDPTDLLEGLPYSSTDLPDGSAGWDRDPPSNTGPGIPVWIIHTNEIVCDPHKSSDITVFCTAEGTRFVNKTIPRLGVGNWRIDSRVFLVPGSRTGLGAAGNVELFFDILDNTGKKIVRITSYVSGPTEGGLLVNDVKITPSTGFAQDWRSVCGAVRPLVVDMNVATGKMRVTYEGWSISEVGVYEIGAVPGSPAKFQITGVGIAPISGASCVMGVTKLNFIES